MLRRMREEEFEAEEQRQDMEITLGPAMLLGIAGGLLLVCGLCFGLGYTAGRSSSAHGTVVTQAAPGQPQAAQSETPQSKPMAKNSTPVAVPEPVTAAPVQSSGSETASQPNASTSYAPAPTATPASAPSPTTNQAVVHPALPAPPPVVSSQSVAQVPAGAFMVQVAAVSRVEDANVLMNALRKHGYEVSLRRTLTDSLIHVQVGPFSSRADANAMSLKLLGDGYNAAVLP
jgi:DedD protein